MRHRVHFKVLTFLFLLFLRGSDGSAQARQVPDMSVIGPQVGQRVPAFSGTDQFGRTQTLESVRGPKGVMVVFFRSADW